MIFFLSSYFESILMGYASLAMTLFFWLFLAASLAQIGQNKNQFTRLFCNEQQMVFS
jgi:hypothetical protein